MERAPDNPIDAKLKGLLDEQRRAWRDHDEVALEKTSDEIRRITQLINQVELQTLPEES